ncbi:uncharacterized protein LOC129599765 [Paramacrobiotus metropolitanus]|uniref:uncharacterized protein LOC129599765 n=1 Tax=Paramacrobiotus metropolitanus TaxID=2943436 RepID=UPI0024461FCF|nr:uncharacterized protein LOC129599765 [Paramacrobiotus metropolitanus]
MLERQVMELIHSSFQVSTALPNNEAAKMNISLEDINLPDEEDISCTALPSNQTPVIQQIINGDVLQSDLVIVRHKRHINGTWLLTIQDAFNLTSNVQIDRSLNTLIEAAVLPKVAKLINVSVIHTSPEKFLFIQSFQLLDTAADRIQKMVDEWEPIGIKRENFRTSKEMLIIELNLESANCTIDGVISNVKGPTKWFKDGKAGEFLSFDIADQSAKIRGVMFQDTIADYSTTVPQRRSPAAPQSRKPQSRNRKFCNAADRSPAYTQPGIPAAPHRSPAYKQARSMQPSIYAARHFHSAAYRSPAYKQARSMEPRIPSLCEEALHEVLAEHSEH